MRTPLREPNGYQNAASFFEKHIQFKNGADTKAFHVPYLGKGRRHENKGARVPAPLIMDSSAMGRRLAAQEGMAQQDHFKGLSRSATIAPPRKVLVTRCIQSTCTDGKTGQPRSLRVFDKRGPKSSTARIASSTLEKSSRIKMEQPKPDPQASETNAPPPTGNHELESIQLSEHDRRRTKDSAEYPQLVDSSGSVENVCREANNLEELFAEHPDSTTITVLGCKRETSKILGESRVAKLESSVSTKEAHPERQLRSLELAFRGTAESEEKLANSFVKSNHDDRKKMKTGPRYISDLNKIGEARKHTEKEQQEVHQKTQATNRAKKRKSDELTFKVNCSSKAHKICSSNASSYAGQNVVGSSSTSIPRATCAGNHKKFKAGPARPFKLRTEERGAAKQAMDAQKKELPSSLTNAAATTEPAAQGMVAERRIRQEELKKQREQRLHRALKMPSFRLPFKPERSTKKLTVPREPNFHAIKRSKPCKHECMAVVATSPVA